MDRKYALIFAVLIAGLIISDVYLFTGLASKSSSREKAIISSITDGDTLKLSDGRIVRLLNINAPEKSMPNHEQSRQFLLLLVNKTVDIEITGTDKYNRNLARIYIPEYLNLALVENGLASKFLVEDSELPQFAKAEKIAIENGIGIWQKSQSFGCFETLIDKKGEKVQITNSCPQINLESWVLKDESRKVYTFKKNFQRINLYSGSGDDNSTDIFWSSTNVWNDDRDSLYIFEPSGRIAHYETYGY